MKSRISECHGFSNMETKLWFGYIFSIFLTILIDFGKAKWTPEKCSDVGYSSNLLCGLCDDLKQFNLSQLEDGCRNCCEIEDDNAGLRFPKATLKVCQ